jgi:hypothetical protein
MSRRRIQLWMGQCSHKVVQETIDHEKAGLIWVSGLGGAGRFSGGYRWCP